MAKKALKIGSIQMPSKDKKAWFRQPERKAADSFIGSFISRSDREQSRGSLLNPKLLEMVIKTINKRPSIAGQFQQGLAKTATKAWNTHLAERRRMTKKQKVVEDIASNMGLAKGFRTEFQDEAERLVSILFKEIGKKKTEEEISLESSESTVEEESDTSIPSLTEIPEPVVVTKPPPKPPVVRKVRSILPHQYHSPYVTTHKRSISITISEEELKIQAPKKFDLSFINVTKLDMNPNQTLKEEIKLRRKTFERFYTEVERKPNEPEKKIPVKKEPLKKLRKKDKLRKRGDSRKSQTSPSSKSVGIKDLDIGHPSKLLNVLDVKGLAAAKNIKKLAPEFPTVKPIGGRLRGIRRRASRDDNVRMSQEKTSIVRSEKFQITKWFSSSESIGRSFQLRQSSTKTKEWKKKMRQSEVSDRLDEKTKQYVIHQIEGMLRMLASSKKQSDLDILKQHKRERKSIFILWKNYFDIIHSENIKGETVGLKRMRRENLLKEVDIELEKTDLYGKIAAVLGEKSGKSPYEQKLWRYLYEKAKLLDDEKERIKDKQLGSEIEILEELAKKARTPQDVLLEEERRRKAMDEFKARLNPPTEKYSAKRPNTRETTMEEILQMRGFRGPPRNSKNTIWIKKPDFIGYLKPMKKKPKRAYEPSKTKLLKRGLVSKKDSSGSTMVTKSSEYLSEYESFPHIISITRKPAIDDDKPVAEPPSQVPEKRPKPAVKAEQGFSKYFGSLDRKEEIKSQDL